MKYAILFVTTLLLLVPTATAGALDRYILSEQQIRQITDHCVESKSALRRIATADALLRVNLGQRYDTIATRLMAPLNSRVAINGLDGVALTEKTVEFNKKRTEFSNSYTKYDRSFNSLESIDCVSDPVGYYQAVEITRADRLDVHGKVTELSRLSAEYRSAVARLDTEND